MATVTADGAHVSWDAEQRLLRAWHSPDAVPTAWTVGLLAGKVRDWAGGEQPYGLFVDARDAETTDPDYRKAWVRFLVDEAARVRVAVCGAAHAAASMAGALSRAPGLAVRVFPTEAEALAWLTEARAPAEADASA